MHCVRCQGLMLNDRYLGLDGQLNIFRCANCGAVVDSKIRQHQTLYKVDDKRRRPRHRFSEPSRMTLLLLSYD